MHQRSLLLGQRTDHSVHVILIETRANSIPTEIQHLEVLVLLRCLKKRCPRVLLEVVPVQIKLLNGVVDQKTLLERLGGEVTNLVLGQVQPL